MHVFIKCSECRTRLRVKEELLGKEIHCPRCAAIFVAPDVGLPEDDPAPPRRPVEPRAAAPEPFAGLERRRPPSRADRIPSAELDDPSGRDASRPRGRRPWYLFLLACVPLGIPLVTMLGVWLGDLSLVLCLSVGIVLAVVALALCIVLALVRWSVALRLTLSLVLSALGFITAAGFVTIGQAVVTIAESEEAKRPGKEFSSAEGRFSITMPDIPVEETVTEDTAAGPVPVHRFVVRRRNKQVYSVTYFEFSEPDAERLKTEEIFDIGRASLEAQANGTVSHPPTERWLDSYPGKDISINPTNPGRAQGRLYITRRRLYTVLVQVPIRDADSGELPRFLDSFKLGPEAVRKTSRVTLSNDMGMGGQTRYEATAAHSAERLREAEAKRTPDLGLLSFLRDLAGIYTIMGKYAQAEPLCRRALSICEKDPAASHEDLAGTLQELGAVLARRGNHPDADRLLERSLALHEKLRNPAQQGLREALLTQAWLRLKQGKPADAEPIARRALDLRQENANVLGGLLVRNQLASTVQPRVLLAESYAAQGKDKEAIDLLEEILPKRKVKKDNDDEDDPAAVLERLVENFGPQSPEIALACNTLGRLYTAKQSYPEAERVFKKALNIHEKLLPRVHPDTAELLDNYAALLRKMNQAKKADEMVARAKDIRTKHAAENAKK